MSANLDRIIVIGDSVLIQPSVATERTKAGLYLPTGYQDKEELATGYIIKCGPGYALPNQDDDESWNPNHDAVKYLPLQVQTGDAAIFMRKNAVEVKYDGEKYYIVPQNAILMVERFYEEQ
jgi:co-chaperonin GroES (HSP10)